MPQNVGRDAAEFSTAAGGHEACLVAAQLCDLVLFHKDPFALGALHLGPLGLDQIGVYGDRPRDSVLGVSSLHLYSADGSSQSFRLARPVEKQSAIRAAGSGAKPRKSNGPG